MMVIISRIITFNTLSIIFIVIIIIINNKIMKKAQFNNATVSIKKNYCRGKVPWNQSLTCHLCHWPQVTVQCLCGPPTTDSSWCPSCTPSIHYCWLLLPSVSDHLQQNRHQVFHRYTQQTVERHNNNNKT
mgnify:CR=1 FL=1